MSSSMATTSNGAVALENTGDSLTDLNFESVRGAILTPVVERVLADQHQIGDKTISGVQALLMFAIYLRNFRSGFGKGEKKLYFEILNHVFQRYPTVKQWLLAKNWIQEVGCWKDYRHLTGCNRKIVQIFKTQLLKDWELCQRGQPYSLCAKWAPSPKPKSGSKKDNYLLIGLRNSLFPGSPNSGELYRHMITELRKGLKLVESQLTTQQYDQIDYIKVPSHAMKRYTKLFSKKDSERFEEYRKQLTSGQLKVKTTGLELHSLIEILDRSPAPAQREMVDLIFKEMIQTALTQEQRSEMICVADTSDSMESGYGTKVSPMTVSKAMALFSSFVNAQWIDLSDFEGLLPARLKSIQAEISQLRVGRWITFSTTPRYHHTICGYRTSSGQELEVSLSEAYAALDMGGWGGSTNFEAVYELLLNSDANHDTVMVISDMQFDQAFRNPGKTLFENMKLRFRESGRVMPKMVFWNVAARTGNVPINSQEFNCLMVSGFSPNIMRDAMSNCYTPHDLMAEILTKVGEMYSFEGFPSV